MKSSKNFNSANSETIESTNNVQEKTKHKKISRTQIVIQNFLDLLSRLSFYVFIITFPYEIPTTLPPVTNGLAFSKICLFLAALFWIPSRILTRKRSMFWGWWFAYVPLGIFLFWHSRSSFADLLLLPILYVFIINLISEKASWEIGIVFAISIGLEIAVGLGFLSSLTPTTAGQINQLVAVQGIIPIVLAVISRKAMARLVGVAIATSTIAIIVIVYPEPSVGLFTIVAAVIIAWMLSRKRLRPQLALCLLPLLLGAGIGTLVEPQRTIEGFHSFFETLILHGWIISLMLLLIPFAALLAENWRADIEFGFASLNFLFLAGLYVSLVFTSDQVPFTFLTWLGWLGFTFISFALIPAITIPYTISGDIGLTRWLLPVVAVITNLLVSAVFAFFLSFLPLSFLPANNSGLVIGLIVCIVILIVLFWIFQRGPLLVILAVFTQALSAALIMEWILPIITAHKKTGEDESQDPHRRDYMSVAKRYNEIKSQFFYSRIFFLLVFLVTIFLVPLFLKHQYPDPIWYLVVYVLMSVKIWLVGSYLVILLKSDLNLGCGAVVIAAALFFLLGPIAIPSKELLQQSWALITGVILAIGAWRSQRPWTIIIGAGLLGVCILSIMTPLVWVLTPQSILFIVLLGLWIDKSNIPSGITIRGKR